jgi:predicted dehydrogenase
MGRRPLRYGVVGCGRVFQQYHLPCLRRPDVELVALCDIDQRRPRQVLPAAGDVLVTRELDHFLARGQLDVISVCTPNDAHQEPVTAALDAGVAVLCEKPLAADLPQARALAARAGTGPLFGVNLPYRFHELLPRFAGAVGGGPFDITVSFTTPGQRVWRPYTDWYGDAARAGGGALLDLGPHVLDLLVAAFGWPRVLSCAMDDLDGMEQHAVVALSFERGTATVRVDRGSRRPAMLVAAHTPTSTVSLDLRRNELRSGEGRDLGREGRPELAAIRNFLDAAVGAGGAVVDPLDALRLQELIADAYRLASLLPSSGAATFA